MLGDTVGRRRAEWMLQLGSLLPPDEALAVGLVDEVVPLDGLDAASAAWMAKLLQARPTAISRRLAEAESARRHPDHHAPQA